MCADGDNERKTSCTNNMIVAILSAVYAVYDVVIMGIICEQNI